MKQIHSGVRSDSWESMSQFHLPCLTWNRKQIQPSCCGAPTTRLLGIQDLFLPTCVLGKDAYCEIFQHLIFSLDSGRPSYLVSILKWKRCIMKLPMFHFQAWQHIHRYKTIMFCISSVMELKVVGYWVISHPCHDLLSFDMVASSGYTLACF